jgi:hypothetical protein
MQLPLGDLLSKPQTFPCFSYGFHVFHFMLVYFILFYILLI